MLKYQDLISPENVASYYVATNENREESLGDILFPAKSQRSLTLNTLSAAGGAKVALAPAAYDTEAVVRDRGEVTLSSHDIPLFREADVLREQDRRELMDVLAIGNQDLIDMAVENVYSGYNELVRSAYIQLDIMRMSVLATGKVTIADNGVNQTFDYNVPAENKHEVTTAWSEALSDPISDIDEAVDALTSLGVIPGMLILNAKTFGHIKKNETAIKTIGGVNATTVTSRKVKDFLKEEYGLEVAVQNAIYKDSKGASHQVYPDGAATFVPAPNDGQAIGRTVFGITPEAYGVDQNGSANVEIVDNGITITSTSKVNPVTDTTIVSMSAMPSFEGASQVYQLATTPSA